MSDTLLDTVDAGTEEAEEQLLQELENRTENGSDYVQIDQEKRDALNDLVDHLWNQLAPSVDEGSLSLRTERHDSVSDRLITTKKLLAASIPVSFLHAIHEALIRDRRSLEGKVKATRDEGSNGDSSADRFGSQRSTRAQRHNKDGITWQEEKAHLPDDDQFADKGIYSASRELHMLAACFTSSGDAKEMMNAAVQGRAVFASKELSSAVPERQVTQKSNSGPSNFAAGDVTEETPEETIGVATTPEEIRRKLAQRGTQSTGASRFEAKELSSAAESSDPPRKPEPKKVEPEKQQFAQTPDEIRRKLQDRGNQNTGKAAFASKDIEPIVPQEAPRKKERPPEPAPTPIPEIPTGKATFASKDIEPISPQEAPRKRVPPPPEPTPKAAPERPSGKAVFESRDLSSDSPTEND
jgi:hypothetical protein